MYNHKRYAVTVFGETYTIASDEPEEVMQKAIALVSNMHQDMSGKCERSYRSLILLAVRLAKEAVVQEEQLVKLVEQIDQQVL